MTKLICSLFLIMVFSSGVAQDQVWQNYIYLNRVVMQRYPTWCLYAVLQMNSDNDQAFYATHYVRNFRNGPSSIDCRYIQTNTSTYDYCVQWAGVHQLDVIQFCNSCSTFFPRLYYLVDVEACFNLGQDQDMPFLAIVYNSTNDVAHAVHLFYVALYNAGQLNQYRIMRYMDPWTGGDVYCDSYTVTMDIATKR